jgi:diguanylate cyclase (GGDEF)-like protein/PAS domain S-box-containing protein
VNALIPGQYLTRLLAKERHARLEVGDRRPPGGRVRTPSKRAGESPWGAAVGLGLVAARWASRRLSERDGYWRRVVHDSPEGFVAIDEQGRVLEWNAACQRMFGWTAGEAVSRPLADLIVPERLREAHLRGLRRYIATGQAHVVGQPLVLPAVRRDGAELAVEMTISPARMRRHTVFYAFLHDATARRRTERYLKAESEVARVLLEGTSLRGAGPQILAVLGEALGWDAGALWLVDEHEHILRCAHTWSRDRSVLCGFLASAQRLALGPGEGLAGHVWKCLEPDWLDNPADVRRLAALDREDVEPVYAALALPLHSQGKGLGVLEFFHASPYPRDDELLQLTMFIAMHIAGYIEQLRGTDLLERSRTVARTDELTGLPNRRALNEQLPERIHEAVQSGRTLSVAMLDLDNFKAFNDLHGHLVGDRLLQESAAAWRAQLRDEDLLARYGGEEFTVILDAPVDQAHDILERLRSATPSGQTCSVGLTKWDERESPEALIARADDALYRAKNLGRDRIELGQARVA